MIIQKLASATRLLSSPNAAKAIKDAARKNVRQAMVNAKHGRAFIYQTYAGVSFVCIPSSDTSVRLFLENGDYEEVESRIVQEWLREGDSCLDIGANVGLMAALFATRTGPTGKVIAVEASAETCGYLRQTIEALGACQIYSENICVMDNSGPVEFMAARNAFNDVRASLKVSPNEDHLFKRETIQAATLNCLVEKYGITHDVALVKIDIEGAEPLALKGGSTLFDESALPLFIIEVHKAALANFDFTPEDVWRYFPPELFQLYHVQRSRSDLTPEFQYGKLYKLDDPPTYTWPWYSNLVAIPKTGKYSDRLSQVVAYLP